MTEEQLQWFMLLFMKKLLIGAIVAAVVLAACGGGNEPVYKHTYTIEGFTVHSEVPLREKSVTHNLQLARRLLVPVIMTETEFAEMRDIPLYVRLANDWNCKRIGDGNVTCSTGNYDATFGISLGGNMQGLVHELLHAWDASSFVLNSFQHPSWDDKGYYALDEAYAKSNLNPTL